MTRSKEAEKRWSDLFAWLEAGGDKRHQFAMDVFVDDPTNLCSTTCCMAGYVVLKEYGDKLSEALTHQWAGYPARAAYLLELEGPIASALFLPRSFMVGGVIILNTITPEQALRAAKAARNGEMPPWHEILNKGQYREGKV